MTISVAAVLLHRLDPDQLFAIERSDDPQRQDWIPLAIGDSDMAKLAGEPLTSDEVTLSDVGVIGQPELRAALTFAKNSDGSGCAAAW